MKKLALLFMLAITACTVAQSTTNQQNSNTSGAVFFSSGSMASSELSLETIFTDKICASNSSKTDEWKEIYTAPHDGTVVETLNTYGIQPTYALVKWSKYELAWIILKMVKTVTLDL